MNEATGVGSDPACSMSSHEGELWTQAGTQRRPYGDPGSRRPSTNQGQSPPKEPNLRHVDLRCAGSRT